MSSSAGGNDHHEQSAAQIEREGRVYLVCDGCGFFYGDVRLYPEQTVECPECGSEAAWAFPKLDKALAMQAQIKEAKTHDSD